MARHFVYKHLPASGLGQRDPRRPYVTGGLGSSAPIFITLILDQRRPGERIARDSDPADPRDPAFGTDRDPLYGRIRIIIPLIVREPGSVHRIPSDAERDPSYGLSRDVDDEIDTENYAEFSAEIEDPDGT